MPQQSAMDAHLMLAFEGHKPPSEVLKRLSRRDAAGFTLFRSLNCHSPWQIRALTAALQAAAVQGGHLPLLIAADQEGGQLNAVGKPATLFAGNMALGAARDPDLARRVGAAIARELAAVGVNVNYAPVCDINTNPDNPNIGIRAISDDPQLAGSIAAALTEGMQSTGVAATVKHFPGIGDAAVDSHFHLPVLHHDRRRLVIRELVPFQAALQSGARLVMTGHAALPALGGSADLPATLSRALMHNMLRSEMGFEGVVISDAFDMGAITQGAGQLVDAIAALRAGVDLLLLTADRAVQERLEAGLGLALSRGLLKQADLLASQERIAALRKWAGGQKQPEIDVIGCREHRGLACELAEKSLTLVRDKAGLLPLRLLDKARILAVMPAPQNLTPADTSETIPPGLGAALRRHHPGVDEIVTSHTPTAAEISAARSRAAKYDLLVIGTLSASMNPHQAALANSLLDTGVPAVTVAMRTPYDLLAYPQAGTHLCTYSLLPESMEALAALLFGKIAPAGILPVVLDGLQP